MKREASVLSALASALLFSAGFALAADPEPARQVAQTQAQDSVYGSQLMTPQERTEYRTRMRATKTAEEREQIRKTHHEQMQDRAKTRGVTLPDEPPARGDGMGRGGGGMGRSGGGGMGPGGGGGMGPGGGGMGQGSGATGTGAGSTGSGATSGR